MQYIIYDTNEYYAMAGRSDRPFEEVAHTVDTLRLCEQQKGLVPIFNSTVAYELINHLCSDDLDVQNRYVRACYALYHHCHDSLPIVTKNPTAAYIEKTTGVQIVNISRTTGFLRELYEHPLEAAGVLAYYNDLVTEVHQYRDFVKSSYLSDLQYLRQRYHDQKDERSSMVQFIESTDYPAYRAQTLLRSAVDYCQVHHMPLAESRLINEQTIRTFIGEHSTYIEICRDFDKTYVSGGFDLTKDSTANTFWDAEICYHLGARVFDKYICVVTEEGRLNKAAQKANQGDYMFKMNQIRN